MVLGIVLSISSIYFLLTDSIFSIFTSTIGVLIVAFSVFEIVRMRKIEPRKEKPINSKAKKSEDDISWSYYDFNERKIEPEVIERKKKVKFTFFSKLFHLSKIGGKPKMVGKGVEKEVGPEKKKVGKNLEKEKLDKLKNYILEAMKNNIPKTEIVKACLASDWPKDKVEKVIGRMGTKGKKKGIVSLVMLLAVTLFVMIGLILSGNFLIGYWLDSLKLISKSAYYMIFVVILISIGVILFDVKDRLGHRKKIYKIKTEESVSEIKEEMKSDENKVVSVGAYNTDMDKLLDLVNERKKLTAEEVSGIFSISRKEAEEWGKILKDEGLISLYYPTVGDVELREKKKVKKEE